MYANTRIIIVIMATSSSVGADSSHIWCSVITGFAAASAAMPLQPVVSYCAASGHSTSGTTTAAIVTALATST
jgi:hypothetical protein